VGVQTHANPLPINGLASERRRPHQQAHTPSKSHQNLNYHHSLITTIPLEVTQLLSSICFP
jgi:hypothetical protein